MSTGMTNNYPEPVPAHTPPLVCGYNWTLGPITYGLYIPHSVRLPAMGESYRWHQFRPFLWIELGNRF